MAETILCAKGPQSPSCPVSGGQITTRLSESEIPPISLMQRGPLAWLFLQRVPITGQHADQFECDA